MRAGYLIDATTHGKYAIVTVETWYSVSNNWGNYIPYQYPDHSFVSGIALVGVEIFESYENADEYLNHLEMC